MLPLLGPAGDTVERRRRGLVERRGRWRWRGRRETDARAPSAEPSSASGNERSAIITYLRLYKFTRDIVRKRAGFGELGLGGGRAGLGAGVLGWELLGALGANNRTPLLTRRLLSESPWG